MAIAFDAVSTGGAVATSLTIAHTCTGSDRILYAYLNTNFGTDFAVTATYNGVPMTAVSNLQNSSASGRLYDFYLINPASGTNNIVFTPNASANMNSVNASYTGVRQSAQPDASGTTSAATASGATRTLTFTTIADNCWQISGTHGGGDLPNASTGFTSRATEGNGRLGDSNAALTPAGSKSMSITNSGAGTISLSMVGISISPAIPGLAGNFFMFM